MTYTFAFILVILGFDPATKTVYPQFGGQFTSEDACKSKVLDFRAEAALAGLDTKNFSEICIQTPYEVPKVAGESGRGA